MMVLTLGVRFVHGDGPEVGRTQNELNDNYCIAENEFLLTNDKSTWNVCGERTKEKLR